MTTGYRIKAKLNFVFPQKTGSPFLTLFVVDEVAASVCTADAHGYQGQDSKDNQNPANDPTNVQVIWVKGRMTEGRMQVDWLCLLPASILPAPPPLRPLQPENKEKARKTHRTP